MTVLFTTGARNSSRFLHSGEVMRTEEEVINFARNLAGLHKQSTAGLEIDKINYSAYLESLISERPWVFAYSITNKVVETNDGNDLGYTYKYRLGVDAQDVIGLGDIPVSSNIATLSPRQASRYGYAVDPLSDRVGTLPAGDFLFVNGVLHTNSPVEKVIYKRNVTPELMEPDFKMLLAHTLGMYFAMTPGADLERRGFIKSERENYHIRACRRDTASHSDPQIRELANFLRSYYAETYGRY